MHNMIWMERTSKGYYPYMESGVYSRLLGILIREEKSLGATLDISLDCLASKYVGECERRLYLAMTTLTYQLEIGKEGI